MSNLKVKILYQFPATLSATSKSGLAIQKCMYPPTASDSNHPVTKTISSGVPAPEMFWSGALFLLFLLFSTTVFAQTPMSAAEAKALRTTVKKQADTTTTITSDFIQYKHLDFLSEDIESKGRLAFKAPDRVKWEYVTPFSYAIIFKDQRLYINDAGNKSDLDIGGNKIFEQLSQLITASIRGNLFDEQQFDISYFKKEGHSLVHLIPKDAQFSEFIKAFHMTFNPSGEVTEVKMIEPSDDYTRIVFSNRKTNQPLSDADFDQ
ncbi:outer membrane lipoprotein carrier protein LolA [Pricia sp. S334]|uniref:Outer membrane lipoprotein carrier protein LolA n=1 Tax=Pricia mediterranea TaxID=3076079 RepID=A0ABU3L5H7_9FLAO|nr:outer membrane lipoprotein carrier protein LolA [Pricia sp. S334]MDT7828601.1 outer membrane lipoprotein carrier protein LolA [Pricia sp. S334]